MAIKPLKLEGDSQQPVDLFIAALIAEFLIRIKCFFKRDRVCGIRRNHFGDFINLPIGHLQNASDVTYHGAGLYTTAERSGEVRLLTSSDGEHWTPLSKEPQCTVMSAEEGEFEFDEAGNLVATIRLEVQGSLVCRASKDDLAQWETHYTREKYDSALMFRRGEAFYVIARRNVAGDFNRGVDWLPASLQRGWNLARYSLTRKRTSLYKVDLTANRLIPLFDFPSRGDTAFPALLPLDTNAYYLVNYSCPLDGTDWPWLGGLWLTKIH